MKKKTQKQEDHTTYIYKFSINTEQSDKALKEMSNK